MVCVTGRKARAALLVAVMLVVMWNMPATRSDAGGDRAMTRTLSGSLPYDLYGLWEFASGANLSPPVAANGMLYVGDAQGTMYALDAQSGELNWSFQAHGRIRHAAAVTMGTVYFASGDLVSGAIYALNAWDGSLRWNYQFTGSAAGAPMVQHPLVYFGYNSQRGNIMALSVFDGVLEWNWKARHYLSGQLAVREDVVVSGTTLTEDNESYLYCIDSHTGQIGWEKTLSGYFSGVSLLPGDQAVVTSGGASTGRIYALDTTTGEQLWSPFRVRPFNFWSPPSVHGESIYTLNKGTVYALCLETGKEQWNRLLPVHDHDGPMPFSHAPLSCEAHLYITYAYADSRLSSHLHVLDRHEGTLLAVHEPGTTLTAAPIVCGRNLYLLSQGRCVQARRGLKITVNGRAIAPAESGAFIREGITHVTLRGLLDTAGFAVEWDGDTRSVRAHKDQSEITIAVDSQKASLACGKTTFLALELINDRLMVAVRALVEFMGGEVKWDADVMSVSCQLP